MASAGAVKHLEAFLEQPPKSAEAERWVRHAQDTLEEVRLAALAPDVEHTSLQAPATLVGPAVLQGAGGEWLDFRAILEGGAKSLRVQPLRAAGGSPAARRPAEASGGPAGPWRSRRPPAAAGTAAPGTAAGTR